MDLITKAKFLEGYESGTIIEVVVIEATIYGKDKNVSRVVKANI